MDQDGFWRIIDESRKKAGRDSGRFQKEMKEQLSRLDGGERRQFQSTLRRYGVGMVREAGWHITDAVWMLEHMLPSCGIDREILRAAAGQLKAVGGMLEEAAEQEETRLSMERRRQEEMELDEVLRRIEEIQDAFFGGCFPEAETQEEGAPQWEPGMGM